MTQLIKSNNKQKPNTKVDQKSSKLTFEAIGTHWQIDINQSLDIRQQESIYSKIKSRIETFDKTYSRFRADSIITEIATKKGKYNFPKDSKKLFTLYKKLYRLTDGIFTPLIGNTLSAAGYDSAYSLKPKKITKTPTWENTITYEHNTLEVHEPTILDFGAGGKGYLIDIIAELLICNKINQFCIDAGGDILYRSLKQQTIRIGLENPENISQVIGVVTLGNQSICGSAGNRRKWGSYHHIINPQTNTSPTNIIATWVIAEETIIADALSTCLFLVSVKTLSKHFKFDYCILFPDYTVEKSEHFTAELFIK
jgi:thiamine biosynthesis lipoprotein